jgi:hypothetical protein
VRDPQTIQFTLTAKSGFVSHNDGTSKNHHTYIDGDFFYCGDKIESTKVGIFRFAFCRLIAAMICFSSYLEAFFTHQLVRAHS